MSNGGTTERTSRSRNGCTAPGFDVDAQFLDILGPSGARGGTLLGSGPRGEPFSAAVVRSAPMRIVCVGGAYLPRQVGLRALATGAWLIVATARPDAWHVLARAAGTDSSGRLAPLVQIRKLTPVELPRPSEDGPLLVIHDGGSAPQDLFPPRAPWQTTLYVLPYLHQQAGPTAGSADLVLAQRLSPPQAHLAARIWRLPPPMTKDLSTLGDAEVLAFGPGFRHRLTLVTTEKEQKILGPVRRGD